MFINQCPLANQKRDIMNYLVHQAVTSKCRNEEQDYLREMM